MSKKQIKINTYVVDHGAKPGQKQHMKSSSCTIAEQNEWYGYFCRSSSRAVFSEAAVSRRSRSENNWKPPQGSHAVVNSVLLSNVPEYCLAQGPEYLPGFNHLRSIHLAAHRPVQNVSIHKTIVHGKANRSAPQSRDLSRMIFFFFGPFSIPITIVCTCSQPPQYSSSIFAFLLHRLGCGIYRLEERGRRCRVSIPGARGCESK